MHAVYYEFGVLYYHTYDTVGIYLRMHLHTRVRDGRFVDAYGLLSLPDAQGVLDCEPGSIPNA